MNVDPSDVDSTYGESIAESGYSTVASSIREGVEENGRTYHSYHSGKYHLPNDEKEQDRLDLQHAMFVKLFDDKLALAPLENVNVHNVLDIATGTGLWAIEFAEQHPSANVIGTDLSAIQPNYIPPNCTFEVDDAEDEWIYPQPFTYIHARAVLSCFTSPLSVIQSAVSALSPGGYLEFQDPIMPMQYDGPAPTHSSFYRWNELSIEAAAAGGRPWTNPQHYSRWFRESGLVDVQEQRFILPMGVWREGKRERELGIYQLRNWFEGLEGMTIRNLARIGWGAEQCRQLVREVKRELLEGEIRAYNEVLVVWGRKME